jgi:arsenical pump membrane protein
VPLRRLLLGAALVALAVAAIASPDHARAAAAQTWPPFVLVAGLLMIGVVANAEGLFEAIGTRAARTRVSPAVLLVLLLGVVAVVTAVLNLDTAVAFLTPVLILAARARGVDEEPFLFGALLMSNAASLLLPGSNLTNLLVLGHDHVAGAVFAGRMLPAWAASVSVTALFTLVVHRRRLDQPSTGPGRPDRATVHLGPGAAAVTLAALFLLLLRSPAVPVVVLGAAVAGWTVRRRTVPASAVVSAVDPATLTAVFAMAVALGTLARGWSGPARLVATAGRTETAVVGALAAVALNNLPAAVLLASRPPPHPTALLLGLNLGPNLAVTGSLSALIWFRAAKAVGVTPSAIRLTRLGVVLVPLSIAASGLALEVFGHATG